MSGWDDEISDTFDTDGADDFFAQLQKEQAGAGFATTNFGAFEDDADELVYDDESSESDMSDDELVDVEDDLDEDQNIRRQISPIRRTFNKYSKPRYLKLYFMATLTAQLALFVALFSLQGLLGNMNSSVILILVAGLLISAQASQARNHMSYTDTVEKLAKAEKDRQVTDDEPLRLKRKELKSWHGRMIFLPGLVAVFCTLIFLIGIFTVLFHYGTSTTNTEAGEEVEVCASGPMSVWKTMSSAGWVFALWHVASYAPVLVALLLLSGTHFRAYNDACELETKTDLNKLVQRGQLGGRGSVSSPGRGSAGGQRYEFEQSTRMGDFMRGKLLRHGFVLSLVFQLVTYIALFWSRTVDRPSGGEQCQDNRNFRINMDEVLERDQHQMNKGNWTGFGAENGDCRWAAEFGYCYSEGPQSKPSLTRTVVAECCKSCAGGPMESGGGVIYFIVVFGMGFWGYQFGEMRTYLKRGADPLDEDGNDTAHDTTTRFAWHSGGIFYGILKAMVGTVLCVASQAPLSMPTMQPHYLDLWTDTS
jgi:hypothetical protein